MTPESKTDGLFRPATGRVARLQEAPLFSGQNGEQTFRATLSVAAEAVAGMSGGWYRIAAGAANQLDMHPDRDEFYFIHRGRATIMLGGEAQRIQAGDAVFVPHGVEHRIVNEAGEDFELFYFFAAASPPFPARDPGRYPTVEFSPVETATTPQG